MSERVDFKDQIDSFVVEGEFPDAREAIIFEGPDLNTVTRVKLNPKVLVIQPLDEDGDEEDEKVKTILNHLK